MLARLTSREHWPAGAGELDALQEAVAASPAVPWEPPTGRPLRGAAVFAAAERGLAGRGAAGDPAWAGAVIATRVEVLERAAAQDRFAAPYDPGRLALREGALLERVFRLLAMHPDVLLVDATGRDHPRRAGLALQLGFVLSIPTVGVTDRPLLASGAEPGPARGDAAELRLGGEVVGWRLRTSSGARPVCVHAAWRTEPEAAREVVLALARSRTPEPLREARRLARTLRASA
jgi:deoxyribonuclease V